jgi:O-antigen ligase
VHNEYLRLGMETGLVGIGLFALALGSWGFTMLRVGRTPSPVAREFALPAAGAILAWAIIAATDNPFDYYSQFTQYVGFFCAAAMAAASLDAKAPAPAEQPAGHAVPEALPDRPYWMRRGEAHSGEGSDE